MTKKAWTLSCEAPEQRGVQRGAFLGAAALNQKVKTHMTHTHSVQT